MTLLMITRKVDKDDWLAGHSFEWAKAISYQLPANSYKLVVICLEKGDAEGIGENVIIESLGKEHGVSRWERFWNFHKLAAKYVRECDGIFCHQNPEYAIAVAPWAFLFGKKIISWYVHKSVTWKTRLMLALSSTVLTASKESFRLPSSKVKVVGHGIDVSKFKATSYKLPATSLKIITVGRVSPVKDLETLILAAKLLRDDHNITNFEIKIIGDVGLPEHEGYRNSLIDLINNTNLSDLVKLEKSVPHDKVHEAYQQADVFVNLSQTGSVDKAVLEAMACENIVVTSNEAFSDMLMPFADLCLVAPNEAKSLSEKLFAISKLNESDRKALGANLRKIVVENHSLDKLAKIIATQFKTDIS